MNVPVTAYRLQFHAGFTFESALGVVEYLKDLGISHIYASPILKAKKGSTHGYDVVDPCGINPELGGEKHFDQLSDCVRALDMGWLQDIVPNHMAFDSDNGMLMDVFEKGSASRFYGFFDINWDHPYANLKGKALAPFLGDFYGNCLKKGEITIGLGEEGFFITYYDLKLPLALSSYAGLLRSFLEPLGSEENCSEGPAARAGGVLRSFRDLNSADGSAVARAKADLWRLYTQETVFREVIDSRLGEMNSTKAGPLDSLHRLLSEQHFRLSFWKVGNDELNYRRFFTVNALIGLKTEGAGVFDYVHEKIFELLGEGRINGIRLDHIDGLYSPLVYMRRLRERAGDLYIAAEKILREDEVMPSNWPIQGTTGYDFLNQLNGIFVDTGAQREFGRVYASFSGMRSGFEALIPEKKRLFMGKHMAGDIDNLAHLLKNILSGNIDGSDFTMYGLRRALVEVMAHFPVYRTYVSELGISAPDRFFIQKAMEKARRTGQDLVYELDAIEKILLMDAALVMSDEEKEASRHFTRRFQQFTGALMAKGAEDTAAYIYNRLVSLNEVGGFPDRFGVPVKEFHDFNCKRFQDWPYSMNCTATHDTKRGEDVRARVNVLSEIPGEWKSVLKLWHGLNRRHKAKRDRESAPDRNDEYFIYQTLIGACPFAEEEWADFTERIRQYSVKAVREAKVHTAWLKPDLQYEDACTAFITKILDRSGANPFLDHFIPFQKRIAHFGILNSLSQVLLKLTAPGVPDIYQGNELWDFNLVDPDNRRCVDFDRRKKILEEIQSREGDLPGLIKELLVRKEGGGVKMFTIYRLLKARNTFRELFQDGEYFPLEVKGAFQNNGIAFARQNGRDRCIVFAPRFLSGMITADEMPLGQEVWKDTEIVIPGSWPVQWEDVITGRSLAARDSVHAGEILKSFPLGLLVSGGKRSDSAF